jgi:hypothetical protein
LRAINLFPTGKMSSCYLSKFGKGSRETESFVFLEKAPGTKKVHIMKSSSPSHQPTQRQNGEGRERNGSSSVEEKKKKKWGKRGKQIDRRTKWKRHKRISLAVLFKDEKKI